MKKIIENNKQIEEDLFLKGYDFNKYEKPSVTVDIAAFSVLCQESENYKQLADTRLTLLLIKRGEHPFKDKWALPGGFLKGNETIEECAYREIKEETNIEPSAIMPIGVFSEINRDPRGRIISNAFTSIITKQNINLCEGGDAAEAKWFNVKLIKQGEITNLYLAGVQGEDNFKIVLKEKKNKYKTIDYDIIEDDKLAFDHSKIIAIALYQLRKEIERFDLIFDFLPEKFTLTDLQKVQEAVLDKKLLPANFRRKVSVFIEETDEYVTGAGHRPAKLFVKKIEREE